MITSSKLDVLITVLVFERSYHVEALRLEQSLMKCLKLHHLLLPTDKKIRKARNFIQQASGSLN